MAYGPGVLDKLHKQYKLLDDMVNNTYGINVWYGEAGDDIEVAKMLLDGTHLKDVRQYLIDNYGEADE